MSDLVTLTIDGLSVSVPKGTSIIEAAKQAGVLVPHYCYHPSLPSPAVCRMCLVEVEKAPKLMPACVTTVAEGQVVHTDSDECQEGARGRARVPAHQSPARLPDLRPGRGVRAAELRVPGGQGEHPVQRVRQAVQPGGGLRARHPLRRPTGAFSAPVASGSWTTWPGRRCSTSPTAATGPTSASTSRSCWITPGQATWSTSARSARCSPRTSCTRRGPGTWITPPASAPAAARAATSPSTPATARWSGSGPAPTSTSTVTSSATPGGCITGG